MLDWDHAYLSGKNYVAGSKRILTFTRGAPMGLKWLGLPLVAACASGVTGSPPDAEDITPPAVVSVAPIDGATGVGTSSAIEVTFTEPIDAPSVTTATLSV